MPKSAGRLTVKVFASFNIAAELRADAAVNAVQRGFPEQAWPEAVWAGGCYSSETYLVFKTGLAESFAYLMALDAQFVYDDLLKPSSIDLSYLA